MHTYVEIDRFVRLQLKHHNHTKAFSERAQTRLKTLYTCVSRTVPDYKAKLCEHAMPFSRGISKYCTNQSNT